MEIKSLDPTLDKLIIKWKGEESLLDLNADRKRLWFEDLRDVNDRKMFDSLPINLNYF